MQMQLETLRIGLKHSYRDPGPENPYVAELKVSVNENTMKISLGQETTGRILHLARDEIVEAAKVQIDTFLDTAVSISKSPTIEGEAIESEG